MSTTIARPAFAEGQILAASDLQASQDHATDQLARHERGLHSWGIASGLALTTQSRATADATPIQYVDVTLTAGMAVDGTGREIIVDVDTRLAEADFAASGVSVGAPALAWFPVFLIGRDTPAATSVFGLGCGATLGTRTREAFTIGYGRPGDAANLDATPPPAVTSGPGNAAWKVPVGFVQWNPKIPGGKFTNAATFDDQGTTVRYAGVRADAVTARGSVMTLNLPAAAVPDGRFVFNVLSSAGVATPLLTIAANGDVTATGKLQGAAPPGGGPGGLLVQSGSARDGIVLPLPDGVTEAMVAPGQGTVHVHLTPRLQLAPPGAAPGSIWICTPIELGVDSRRLIRCLLRFVEVPGGAQQFSLSGYCDYLMLVALPTNGGTP
jgi:hypothetical protein